MESQQVITSKLAEHTTLFAPSDLPEVHLDEISEANDTNHLTPEKINLGNQIINAFHDKSNPNKLRELVALGAPVNFRLDYGLEISLESHFVYGFFLLLEGDKGEEQLLSNINKVFTEHTKETFGYLKTAPDFYHILHSSNANNEIIPINPKYIEALKLYVSNGRGNPYHRNGTLILAAGIRDPKLVSDLISSAQKQYCPREKNGGLVNFIGWFDDTAAVWSAILLDYDCLSILLANGAAMEKLGVLKASLLDWVTMVTTMAPTPTRIEKAKKILDLLISHGIDLNAKNLLGKSAIDYATGEFKEYLSAKIALLQNRPRY